jgi:predicted DNA-binding transcriptional regulator AlpA
MFEIRRRRPAFDPAIRYLSANDLAARYSVHVITIWKWVQRGLLPAPERIGPNSTRWRSDLIAAHEWARRRAADLNQSNRNVLTH